MPSYQCDVCNIHYPPIQRDNLGGKCLKCGGPVEYFTNKASDKDWQERVNGKEPETPLPWGPHPDEDSCTVVYRNDTDTIHVLDKDLRGLGYTPESGDVVKLNGKYYELLGYSTAGSMWWLERFNFEKSKRQIRKLPVFKELSSDDIVALDHDNGTIYWDPRLDPFRELTDGKKEAPE